jgi:alkanesulfonate monooxygenase SsuD/methylene tetrahydromethanopterin reductase-like flavin-dependent oxidoreductase (luciferase family)
MPNHQSIVLAVNIWGLGTHVASWRATDRDARAFLDAGFHQDAGRIAERGLLDAVFLADGPAISEDPALRPAMNLEPTVLLSAIASATTHVGLVASASTTFNDPRELADRLLTLDVVSGGRLGWNVVTTFNPAAAGNFGLDRMPTSDERYAHAASVVAAVQAAWREAPSASAQGHPVLLQAGGSTAGRELAGRHASMLFSSELSLQAGIDHYREVKGYATAAGRRPQEIAILPGLVTVIGGTEAEAVERFEALERLGPPGFSVQRASQVLGVDLAALEPETPLTTELLEPTAGPVLVAGFREAAVRMALDHDMTVRQLLRAMGGYGHRIVIGAPEQVADTIEQWVRAGAADGFNVIPDVLPDGLETFVDHVVPELQRRGLFRREYGASTLRGRLEESRSPS